MATNEVHDKGNQLSLPVPAGVLSGHPVVVGQIPGVALIDRRADGLTTVKRDGVHNFQVTGAVANVGDIIYATVAAGLVTGLSTTAGGNIRFGYAMATQAATGTIPVILGY